MWQLPVFIYIYLYFYSLTLLITPIATETPLNVAPFVNATSTSTCGRPPAVSCPILSPRGIDEHRYERCFVCNSSIPQLAHPISNILSGSKSWWQSANNVSNVNVTIELGQKFAVYSVIIEFGPSPNPRQWILERSTDGRIYLPWRYFGDHKFCGEIESTLPRDETIFCTSKYSTLFSDGQVVIKLTENESKFPLKVDLGLHAWLEATHLRLRFNQLQTLSGAYYPKDARFESRLYYTIRNIEIYAKALCPLGHLSVPVDKIPPFCERDSCTSCVLELVDKTYNVKIDEELFETIGNRNVSHSNEEMKLLHNAARVIYDKLDPAVASLVMAYELFQHDEVLAVHAKRMIYRVNRLFCASSNNVQIVTTDLIPRLEALEESISKITDPNELFSKTVSEWFREDEKNARVELQLAKEILQTAREYLAKVKIYASNVRCVSAMFPTCSLLRALMIHENVTNCTSSLNTAKLLVTAANNMLREVFESSELITIQSFFKTITAVKALRSVISDELEPAIELAESLTYLKHFGDFTPYPTIETLNFTEKTLTLITNVLRVTTDNEVEKDIDNDEYRFNQEKIKSQQTTLLPTSAEILNSKRKLQQRLAELKKLKAYSNNMSKTVQDIAKMRSLLEDIDNDLNFPLLQLDSSKIGEITAVANRALELVRRLDLDDRSQKFKLFDIMGGNASVELIYSHAVGKLNETVTNTLRKVRDLTRKSEHRKTAAGRLFGHVRKRINNLKHTIRIARKFEKSLFKPHRG